MIFYKYYFRISNFTTIEFFFKQYLQFFGTNKPKIRKLRPAYRGQLVNDISEQREYMDRIFTRLKLKTWENWYEIKKEELDGTFQLILTNINLIKEQGGTILIQQYNYSLASALQVIYPEYNWDRRKFRLDDIY